MIFSGPDNPQNCPFLCGISTPSNTWFLGPTRVYPPIGISIGLAVFAGLTNTTNRQTDRHTAHATPSVAIDRILCTECMRRGRINVTEAATHFCRRVDGGRPAELHRKFVRHQDETDGSLDPRPIAADCRL